METKVKQYQRIVNGKVQTVRQHDRTEENKKIYALNKNKYTETDRKILESIQSGKELTGEPLVRAVTLVGLAAGTVAAIKMKHASNVSKAAQNVVKNPDISDYRYLSRINDAKIPDNFDNYDGVIITTGGFAREGGGHADRIGQSMKEYYPNHYIITVKNEGFDLGYYQKRKNNFLEEAKPFLGVPSFFWEKAWKGNPVSEDLSRVAYNVRLKTDKPITVMTASGGGMATKEALEITQKIGLEDIRGIGLGSPTFNLATNHGNYYSVMDKADKGTGKLPVAKTDIVEVKRADTKVKNNQDPYQGFLPAKEQHEYPIYMIDPNSRSVIDNLVYRTKNRLPEDYETNWKDNTIKYKRNKSKPEFSSYLDIYNDELESLAKLSIFSNQEVKVKQYLRDGKVVRSYNRTQDKKDENLKTVAKTAAIGTVALIGGVYVTNAVSEGALSLARRSWNEAYPKRVRLIEDNANKLASGTIRDKKSGKTLASLIRNADTIIYTKGGINMGGTGGTVMKKDILEYAKKNKKNWAVIDLDNLELDSTSMTAKGLDANQVLSDWWNNFMLNPFKKGYNEDSIELASYVRATEILAPEKKKVIMGYSAGGVASIATASDLSKMRKTTNTSVITVGAPYSGITTIEDRRVVDTVSFINENDLVANSVLTKGNKQNINPLYISRKKQKTDTLLTDHLWDEYIKAEGDTIFNAIEEGSSTIFKYRR